MKSEAVYTGRLADRFVLMAVTRRGRSGSQLASGLAESRSLTMLAGWHLFVPLSNVAGSLTWRYGMSVSYTLPASRTRPNAAGAAMLGYDWLDGRTLGDWQFGVKLLCGRFLQQ
jgi:hypothetical protein